MNKEQFIEGIKGFATEQMFTAKELPPALLILTDKGVGVLPAGEFMGSIAGKNALAEIISTLRVQTDLFCFITEAWVVKQDEGNLDLGCAPSEHPDRTEQVMLTIYEGTKVEMWVAPILRSGELVELREWEQMPNSVKMTGRFMDSPAEFN